MRNRRPRGWRRVAKQWAVVLAVLYVVYGGLLMGFQERLIFPRGVPGARDALAPVRPGWEALAVAGEDGSRVPAWLKLPEQRRAGEKVPAVVFFHGNAEVIDDIADSDEVDMYPAMGIAVLLVEYRGYGRAGGAPSAKATGPQRPARAATTGASVTAEFEPMTK